jgi:hypothetical protein
MLGTVSRAKIKFITASSANIKPAAEAQSRNERVEVFDMNGS